MKRRVPTQNGIYHPEYAHQARKACSLFGATLADLAKLFHTSRDRIRTWMDHNIEFFEAVRDGRYDYDTRKIERTLKQLCQGYEYTETEEHMIVLYQDGEERCYIEKKTTVSNGKRKNDLKNMLELVPGVKRIVKHRKAVPNVVGLMFWLQNRQPDLWKNVQRQVVEASHKHEHKHDYDFDNLDRHELEQLREYISRTTAAADEGESGLRTGKTVPHSFREAKLAHGRN